MGMGRRSPDGDRSYVLYLRVDRGNPVCRDPHPSRA